MRDSILLKKLRWHGMTNWLNGPIHEKVRCDVANLANDTNWERERERKSVDFKRKRKRELSFLKAILFILYFICNHNSKLKAKVKKNSLKFHLFFLESWPSFSFNTEFFFFSIFQFSLRNIFLSVSCSIYLKIRTWFRVLPSHAKWSLRVGKFRLLVLIFYIWRDYL